MATANGSTMHSFQKHIEDMRSLTLCKICLKPFFEPYIISCGHTYCYGCLRSWFCSNNDRTKTKSCPDCRVAVRVQPAPNYILRDLTHMFTDRAELLPEDESVQEHAKDKEDAAAQLTKDREGPGLFQGVFDRRLPTHMLGPIRDLEDGVERCPVCSWEIEDGFCAGCGLDLQDSDFDSEESVDTLDPVDPRPPQGIFYGVGSESEEEDSEDESNLSGPDEYDRNDDFLDNENEDDVDDMDDMDDVEGMVEHGPWYSGEPAPPFGSYTAAARRRRIADSDEEEPEDDPRRSWRPGSPPGFRLQSEDSATNYDESDDQPEPNIPDRRIEEVESDDDQPVIRSRISRPFSAAIAAASAPPSRSRPIVVSDDDDEENVQSKRASVSAHTRPESSASDEVVGQGDALSGLTSELESSESDSGSDSESGSESSSESESESESESNMDSGPASTNDLVSEISHISQEVSDSEDSDDTILPPQSRHLRQQRLQNQRARLRDQIGRSQDQRAQLRDQRVRLQSRRAETPDMNQAHLHALDLPAPTQGDHPHVRPSDALAQRGQRGRARATRVY